MPGPWKAPPAHTLIALRNQGMTLELIGTLSGITRERVRQILKAHGQPTGWIKCRCGRRLTSGRTICLACEHLKPKPVKRVGYFVCSKCSQPFTLSGAQLTRVRENLKQPGITGTWCPACNAKRVTGKQPYRFTCEHCGAVTIFRGPRASYARYHAAHGRAPRFCSSACSHAARTFRARRDTCLICGAPVPKGSILLCGSPKCKNRRHYELRKQRRKS